MDASANESSILMDYAKDSLIEMSDATSDNSLTETGIYDDDYMDGIEESSKGKGKCKWKASAFLESREEISRELVDMTLDFESSYTRGIAKSIQQQAAEEPDFIGAKVAHYYNLKEIGVQNLVQGQYVIVFACNPDVPPGSAARHHQVFEPNAEENCFHVYTQNISDNRPLARRINTILNAGNLAALSFSLNGQEIDMRITHPPKRKWANTIIIDRELVRKNEYDSKLEQVMVREHLLDDQSWMSFGARLAETEDKGMPPGFEFAELQLAYFNPYTRSRDRLQVIGVKIPEDRDVGSAFLLRQKVPTPRKWDWWIFPEDKEG